ncbi:MAG: PDZ domain-containing protein [Myxococcales bacterium]
MTTAYTIRVRQPEARRAEIELAVDARGAATLDVRLPVWTPGSYLVREHPRHVDGLVAHDQDGRSLAVDKADKSTWRITCAGAARVVVGYRLGCFELTVRTNHVDPTHAFLNPAAACAFVVGREAEACEVRVDLPSDWKVWVALRQQGGSYLAADYDELADSPFEMGPLSSHTVHPFTAQGVPHELVVWGRGDFDANKALPDIQKIIAAEAALFGGLPYADRYLFILHLNDKNRGGLEHRRSCALVATRFSFAQRPGYEDFLLLVAHEFFHLWNVKRLRPAAFTPYDWSRENHTGLLWAMEGLTSHYEVVALRRAGLISAERFLEIWAERATQLLRTPGRLRTPLYQASFDAWIKHYRPDETTANTTVSYYLKGALVGLLLDLELRKRSGGSRSLDDLMRLLFARHGGPPGLPEGGVESGAQELLGAEHEAGLRAFFDRSVRSVEELDFAGALAAVGLRAVVRPAKGADDKGSVEGDGAAVPALDPLRSWSGAAVRERSGALEVASVAEGSPAQKAGLGAGDEIVAIDGFRSDLKGRLSRAAPQQSLRLGVFRMDELIELRLVLAPAPGDTMTLLPDPAATPQQRAARAQWLGAAWPETEGSAV